MPVSHSHKFVFVHVPKVAGTSVMQAFDDARVALAFRENDFEPVLAALTGRRYLLAAWKKAYLLNSVFPVAHMQAAMLREVLPAEQWQSYFKFGFVRNPWEYILSVYSYLVPLVRDPAWRAVEPAIAELVYGREFSEFIHEGMQFYPDQTSFLGDEAGRIIVDFVGRLEQLPLHLDWISRVIGVPLPVGHANRSDHAHYRDYFTEETRELVRRHFARDIERFGYSF